ncbi:MAG TPA: YciI family protein [Thermoplasmata archaeon]|nr:YciI family protein [Thermoplasmata archaeon]
MPETPPTPSEVDRLPPMTHYVLGLLHRPSGLPSLSDGEAARLQEAHLAQLRRLRESGELIASGPLEEETALRGILIFRTSSVARARELMRDDPAVSSGRLRLELYTWFAPAGLSTPGATPAPLGTELTFDTD